MTKTKKNDVADVIASPSEALEDIDSHVRKVVKKDSLFSLRNFIWNYPLFFVRGFKKLIPFSYILLFGCLGVLLSLFLQSEIFANILDGGEKKDTYVEGSIGSISSFNPLFVSNNYVDRSVESLVFDKFLYIDNNGSPSSGIAQSWTSSDDDLSYDFVIATDKKWQDGTSLTVDDVVFTFETAIRLANDYGYDTFGSSLNGVVIEKISSDTVRFTLDEVNPVFFEAISVYIVPKAWLESVDLAQMSYSTFAKNPIGSGKYQVVRTEENAVYLKDNVYDEYEPSIKSIVFKVFSDSESLEMSYRIGALDAIGGWDRELFGFIDEYSNVTEYSLREKNRLRLIFFNMRKDSLDSADVRKALNYLLDKESLFKKFNAGVYPITGPIMDSSWAYNSSLDYYSYNPESAAELLKSAGYTKNWETGFYESENGEILNFTVSYFDSLTNERFVNLLSDFFANEGVVVKGEKLTYSQITQEVIATRDFEMLLYEVETTIDPDQYSLWHSLKVDYPNLNLSGFDYERVDILLEDARTTTDESTRKEKYALFQKYLMADVPAIFLYNPMFSYYVNSDLKGIDLSNIHYSFDRFHNVEDWYWED